MPGALTVHLNRDSIHAVEVDRGSLEASGTFSVEMENHGSPTHVHVHLADGLAAVAALPEANHYLREGETKLVQVQVRPGREDVRGTLEVVTGYGAERAEVAVSVPAQPEEPDPGERVRVDESLGEKQPARNDGGGVVAEDVLAPAFVAVAGILVTLLAILTLDRVVAAFVAAVALLGGFAAAGFLYRQG